MLPRNKRLGALRRSVARVLEAVSLAVAGGLMACAFVGMVVDFAGGDQAAVTATGLLFLIWPGVLNLLTAPFGSAPVDRDALLHLAFAVGALTGGFDGAWAIHRWRREGVLSFLLDVTWGLAGSTNAVLLHVVNLGWGRHARGDDERRQGAHRYAFGFAPGPGFAFTQGSVMSNTRAAGPGTELFAHEQVHIWQNRIAGPVFWVTYIGWQVVATPLAIVAAVILRRPVGRAVQRWAYYDNPWEVMAYDRANPGVRLQRR